MCPHCGDSLPTLLGRLGSLVWLRCRSCGFDYSAPVDSFTADEIDEINDSLSGDDNEQ